MCRRSKRFRDDRVLGDSGILRIALRGPGCIDGTGRCQGVLGTGGRTCCGEVLGTGGRRHHDEVLGERGDRCEEVLGAIGRRHCRHDKDWLWDLETPITVPR
ncbi:MAG: hypothetical protein AAGU76_04050 [Sedimentibacter sp.]|uniref:hypothetical protein n=1 Tax=Sedimentibacter sp. TaxID=1960295 RepID=UPI0031586546